MIRREELRALLERIHRAYNRRSYAENDPIAYLYAFDRAGDRELVALVASSLAFGNIKQIMRSVESVLDPLGDAPVERVMSSSPRELRKMFAGFKHRWARGEDLTCLLLGARHVIERYGSLENCCAGAFRSSHRDVVPALTALTAEIARGSGDGTGCLLPSPCRGSACKRLNLFLRWMVRRDDVDPGGWRALPAAKLVVPLDVHMHRWGRALGFTARRQADLRAAREVTDAFRKFAPDDPVRYDFALTRLAVERDGELDAFHRMLGLDPATVVE